MQPLCPLCPPWPRCRPRTGLILYTNDLGPDRQRLARRQKVELKLRWQRSRIEQLGTLITYIVHQRRRRGQPQPPVGTGFEEFVDLLEREVLEHPGRGVVVVERNRHTVVEGHDVAVGSRRQDGGGRLPLPAPQEA